MRVICWGALCAVMLVGANVRAQGIFEEFQGIRSRAMGGAHRGLGTSNDALLTNPAGMIMSRRYSVDLAYAYEAADDLNQLSLTAVDSKSGPVAGAIGYTHVRGDAGGYDPALHKIYMGVAYPIMANLGFGITGRNIRGEFTDEDEEGKEYRREIDVWTGDIGIATKAQGFGLGLAFNNVVRTDVPRMTPPSVGLGVGYAANFLSVAADVVADTRKSNDRKYSYHLGAEYFAAGQFPIRAGYSYEPFVRTKDETDANENVVGFGLGWVSQGGSLEVAFTQSIERGKHWSIVGAMKFSL